MLRYWITTHWPLYRRNRSPHHDGVYLQEGTQEAGRELHEWDKVLIYESRGGKTRVETLVDGTTRPIESNPGRAGIVTVADISSSLTKVNPAQAIQTYTDGTTKNWAWEAKTKNHISSGFVPLAAVNRALGYAPGSVLRGFGDRNSGLKEIDKATYDTLVQLFRRSSEKTAHAPAPGGKPPPPGHWREGGGEGPEHLALKEYVAKHPALVFGEPDIETVKVEYPFPSGDQADIILKDEAGRFIGVEIEIEQRDGQLEGLLQAIKYRHMVAVTEGARFDECRAALIAYRLAKTIKNLARKYDVETFELDRRKVTEWRNQKEDRL
jgi:hypothetical protein